MTNAIHFVVRRISLIATLLFMTVGCDQVSKVVVRDTLSVTGPLSYLFNSVRLQLAQNPGAFLSLGAQLHGSTRFFIFNVVVTVFLGILALQLVRNRNSHASTTIGLTLVLAGGLGNLIDRFLFGSVTDFMILSVGGFHTGIFNFADVAIMIGVFVMMVGAFRQGRGVASIV